MSPDSNDPTHSIQPPPALMDAELQPLLTDPFVRAWAQAPRDGAPALRQRLLDRLAATRAAEAGMVTVRRQQAARETLAPGVQAQWLYRAADGQPRRPGEPLRVRLLELAPGATLPAAALAAHGPCHREWLLLQGQVRSPDQGLELTLRDYHVCPTGTAWPSWHSAQGALLFLRESDLGPEDGDAPRTVRDQQAGWPDYAPGIQRRVLWQRQGQAALLYFAQPGASVPVHNHGHDEECLMVQGELFLDDLLLQAGDYQLAPAGSGHRITATDTGVVIYAHGDLDLKFTS
ncbi:cupin domain-containing protein [Burkholderiales bacterium JOSHI_001]|nr:cupin domain-containing protein [Burkholderiales bacterium JOSHI_001]